MPNSLPPSALGIMGSTQPEVFQSTVEAMAQQLLTDPVHFWLDSVAKDGPIEVWILGGKRYLFNGNHRFQAALQAGVEIPNDAVLIVDRTGSQIPTYTLANLTWLRGFK